MSPNLALAIVVGVLFATGVTLLLERSLTRVLLGILLIGNGVNLLILLGGQAGGAPLVGVTPEEEMSDPLPQALVLTAIVITFGLSAFLLAMAYRSWQLIGHDEVQDDLEDRRIVQRAARDEGAGTEDEDMVDESAEESAGDSTDEAARDLEQVDPEPAPRHLRENGPDA